MTSQEEINSLSGTFRSTSYFRQCSVCGKSGTPSLFDECDKCNAVIYCGEKCKTDDWLESHQDWCSQFKIFMLESTKLAELPFDFSSETTGIDFNEQRRKEFFDKFGVFGQGLWRLVYQPLDHEEIHINSQDKNLDSFSTSVVDKDVSVLEVCPPPPDRPLNDWKDYYSFRGFPQYSPISVLLHYPLTLYHIITQLLPQDYPETDSIIQQSKRICVHVIGAEREVEMFSLFLECARLLSPISLDLHLCGINFGGDYNGQELEKENLHFQTYEGLYHKINLKDIPSPSVAVCFNGGIGAYTSYFKTIKLLMRNKTPLYYTDYGQASILFSTRTINNSKVGHVSPPAINPFRSPLRMVASDQNLPRYSNAFITHIKPFSCSKTRHSFLVPELHNE